MSHNPDLLFVYNANSGLIAMLSDITHRLVSPQTYPCQLCALTYALNGMSHDWKVFIASLDRRVTFLHRDELQKLYGIADVPLPAVFKVNDSQLQLWIKAEHINRCQTLDDLKQLIKESL
ncbi:MAG: hypothetical protein HZC38_16060 [Chloroflexi bacterium]|nr:hypothetical protein [Chloroflexota bacterium]